MTRKWCFVPKCTNTSRTAPHKIFITVPKDIKKKKLWFAAARRAISEVSEKSTLYCCEDHFNLEYDMANYMEYKLSNVRARIKEDVVPHLFITMQKETMSEPEEIIASTSGIIHKREAACQTTKLHFRKKKLRMYTGIPLNYLELIKILENKTNLKKQYIYLILYKIKSNDSFAKIGDFFGTSKSNACRIFSKGVHTLAEYMKKLIFWPSKKTIQINLPIQFRLSFSRVQSIIDCLEIEIQKPTAALQQSLSWSDYKKCNTLKYLISATPDGLINFISCGYGGRISDSALLEDCGYLEVLPENCAVMADRGFKQIEGLLNKKNCTLVRPPSVSSGKKMTAEEVVLQNALLASGFILNVL
ncbi:hypothetical protein RN001_001420 [Aquatica leii]|uniref:THAP-type domain-containing protein n=1 Tax=Aquatica leii TaxID=1421715 RepID=A0AAN7SL80_9COLE|nr:hypothetical protein RN001_001420 [Aquatica leii]